MRTLISWFFVLSIALLPAALAAQNAPRQLTEKDIERLRDNVTRSKDAAAKAAVVDEQRRQQRALEEQQEELRRREQELAYEEEVWEDEAPQQISSGSVNVLEAFTNTFSSEMARKDQEEARQQRMLDNIRRNAEAADRERQRELERKRLAQERARLEGIAQQQRQQAALQSRQTTTNGVGTASMTSNVGSAGAASNATSAQQQASLAREEKLRVEVAAERERQKKLRESQQAAQADVERKRLVAEKAEADRSRTEDRRRIAAQQSLQQAEQSIRTSFRGSAITCVGGGKDVLYLKSTIPPKTGCNVSFEARCPGMPVGAGVRFSQDNYIGASCGMGDSIRIGQMSCPSGQVHVDLTDADCG